MKNIIQFAISNDDERSYDETFGKPHASSYKDILGLVKQKELKTEIAVDLGCGSGYGVEMLSGKFDFVYGIDYSNTAILYSKLNRACENSLFFTWELPDIPLIDNTVDLVTSIDNFEHIERKDAVEYLQEVERVLAPLGMFCMTTPTRCSERAEQYHHHHYTLKELSKLVEEVFSVSNVIQNKNDVLIAVARKI